MSYSKKKKNKEKKRKREDDEETQLDIVGESLFCILFCKKLTLVEMPLKIFF